MTPLENVVTLESGASLETANALLSFHSYTAAPVANRMGTIIGVYSIQTSQRNSAIDNHMSPLSPANLIAADATFPDLLSSLSKSHLLLVLERNTFTGIITPADIWTTPARVYLYSILATLESGLADYLRTLAISSEEIDEQLGPNRSATRNRLKGDLVSKDLFIDDISTLSLLDLIDVCRAQDTFRSALSSAPIGINRLRRGIIDLRNDVMHPSRPLRGVGADGLVGTIQEKIIRIRVLTDVCARATMATA